MPDRPANRLIHATSPYLLQHAHNPVDWHPWGARGPGQARREDRPIFLSIGYSACHWCHVMERESFEDEEVAGVLNEKFVPIKVDREERPDLDELYMAAVQAMTGQRRLAHERLAHAGPEALLRRHLLPAHPPLRHARLPPGAGRSRPGLAGRGAEVEGDARPSPRPWPARRRWRPARTCPARGVRRPWRTCGAPSTPAGAGFGPAPKFPPPGA